MSEKIQVSIEIDQSFEFFPVTKEDCKEQNMLIAMSMWIDVEFYQKWKEAAGRYSELSAQLEQLYRIQQGLQPYENVEVPRHELVGE